MKSKEQIRKWTAKDTYDYSMCYYPLFKHMSDEHGLTLLHQEMDEIMLAAKMVEQNLQNSFGHLAVPEQICKACGKQLDEVAIPSTGLCTACFTSNA